MTGTKASFCSSTNSPVFELLGHVINDLQPPPENDDHPQVTLEDNLSQRTGNFPTSNNVSPTTDYLTPVLNKPSELSTNSNASSALSSTQNISSMEQITWMIISMVHSSALLPMSYTLSPVYSAPLLCTLDRQGNPSLKECMDIDLTSVPEMHKSPLKNSFNLPEHSITDIRVAVFKQENFKNQLECKTE